MASAKSIKLFTFSISLFGMTMLYHYEGKLISYVLSRNPELPINNLEDILKHHDYQLMVQSGSAEEDYFKLAKQWPKKEIWEKTMSGNENAFVSSKEMNTRLMNNEKAILFCIAYYSEMYLPNYPCHIKRLGGAYLQGSTNALGFPPESPYEEVFSHMLTKMKNFGTWNLIRTRMEEQRKSRPCLIDNDGLSAVDYKNTFSLFVLLGFGCLVGILYSLIETIHHEIKNRISFNLPKRIIWNENVSDKTKQEKHYPIKSIKLHNLKSNDTTKRSEKLQNIWEALFEPYHQ
jgi:hypothetical protein